MTTESVHANWSFPTNIRFGAGRIAELIARGTGMRPELDEQSGFDHGVWNPLLRIYPAADIPVVALSIDPDRQANLQRQAFTGANTSAEALAGVRGGRVLAPCLRGGPSPLPGPAGTPWPVGLPGTPVLAASH